MLTDLIDSGALCAVDGVFVEYHDADFERIGAQAGSLRRAALVTMRDAVRSLCARPYRRRSGAKARVPPV